MSAKDGDLDFANCRGLHESLCADLDGSGVRSCHVVFGKVSSAYFDHNPGVEGKITYYCQIGAHHIARGVCRGYRNGGKAAAAAGGLPARAAHDRLELCTVPMVYALADKDY